ncbi:MAG: hypothetical protein ACYTGX_09385 [Planctomycetota bacterium]|jgi:hypothetical protein
MPLTRLQFLVLNNLADGPEPFSALYIGLLEDLDELVHFGDPENGEVGIDDVAYALEDLAAAGLVELDGGAGAVDGGRLADHYGGLDEEIGPLLVGATGGPFRYSQGEWRFAITPEGEREWNNPAYAEFYPDDDEDDGVAA